MNKYTFTKQALWKTEIEAESQGKAEELAKQLSVDDWKLQQVEIIDKQHIIIQERKIV